MQRMAERFISAPSPPNSKPPKHATPTTPTTAAHSPTIFPNPRLSNPRLRATSASHRQTLGSSRKEEFYLGLFGFAVDAAISVNYFDAHHGRSLRNEIPAEEMYHD
jgi:hypothetical protein